MPKSWLFPSPNNDQILWQHGECWNNMPNSGASGDFFNCLWTQTVIRLSWFGRMRLEPRLWNLTKWAFLQSLECEGALGSQRASAEGWLVTLPRFSLKARELSFQEQGLKQESKSESGVWKPRENFNLGVMNPGFLYLPYCLEYIGWREYFTKAGFLSFFFFNSAAIRFCFLLTARWRSRTGVQGPSLVLKILSLQHFAA